MKRHYQKVLLTVAVCIVVVISAGCMDDNSKSTTRSGIPVDKVIFVEYHSNTFGETITGTYPNFMYIDFPTYQVDEENQILQSVFSDPLFDVNDSLIAVIGSGISLSGTAGGGASTWLYPAYSLPAYVQEITLESVFENETVDVIYNNISIRLTQNESYSKSYTRVEEDVEDGWMIERKTTDTIKNYGFIEKSNLIWGAHE